MKKLLIVVWVLLFACGVFAGPLSDQLDQIRSERDQSLAAFQGRAIMMDMADVLIKGNAEIQVIVDSGNFDTLPTELKAVLNRWRLMWKQMEDDMMADPEIIEVYQWRP